MNYYEVLSSVMLLIASVLGLVRLLKGPSLQDRVMALDLMVTVFACWLLVLGVFHRDSTYLDVFITLSIVGFFSAMMAARYLQRSSR